MGGEAEKAGIVGGAEVGRLQAKMDSARDKENIQ
jgi:hypothetical protein